VLTGSGDGDGVFTVGGEGDGLFLFLNEDAHIDADRTDAELLVNYAIPETSFSVYGGLRYVAFDYDQKGTIPYKTGTGGFDVFRSETQTDLWIAELGLGAAVNITETGRHRFFSNITFGMAFLDWDYSDNGGYVSSGNDSSPMLDFNAGYQYNINERIGFSARYRLFTISYDTGYNQDKLTTIHGPEIGFTVRF